MSNSRPRTAALALIACGAVATARAQEAQEQDVASRSQAEIALSNDTAQLRYLTPGEKVGVDRSRASATFFLSEERDIVLSADLMFPADIGGRAFEIRFGPRPYAALLDEENDDVLALSVAWLFRFRAGHWRTVRI